MLAADYRGKTKHALPACTSAINDNIIVWHMHDAH